MSYLPENMMDAEDNRMIAELRAELEAATMESPYQRVCDMLDPVGADHEDLKCMAPEERRLVLLYAKLGRNHFLRHIESNDDDQT